MKKKFIFLGVRLEAMLAYSIFFDIKYVITVKDSYVYKFLKKKKNIKFYIINKNNIKKIFKKLYNEDKCSIICSAGFPYILPENVLKNFKTKINSHPSLLPKFKGKSPIKEAFKKNTTKIGVSIHHMKKQVDAGKVLNQDYIYKKNLKLNQIYHIIFGYLEPTVIIKGMQKSNF